ncbi:putative flavin-containing amine oxidase [Gordonia effusa NBRC 100432]|uniref:Putative flavin-containing amine oxidase n=1 Tax=Gordonia effusa NBRC 100432 TaxID=1077974 RepID=H0R6J2_9ACTN|nr:FAD-dependent oxidoreductase [Gordonia effusa]GAB20693.1 putative flavin-containing amine oxidase [Gordonia effusa NBRC 100432]
MSDHDVIVIGAGLAGLTAAWRLVQEGVDAVVLEARDRVGGRTLNHHLDDGQVVEAGGQFIGPTQDRILRLAGELGVETFLANTVGESVYVRNGRSRRYRGDIPPDLGALPAIGIATTRLNRMSAQVPVHAPWTASRAGKWDSMTLESWLRSSTPGSGAVDLINIFLGSAFGGAARDSSLLFALWYIATFGNETHPGTLERGIGVARGAQESRFVGGSQELSLRLAARLGDRVRLSTPVDSVRQQTGRVIVGSGTDTVSADAVVVAVPPVLASRIDWEPGLPVQQQGVLQRLPFGALMKCEAIYPEPFWREDGLNGSATFRNGSAICSMFDNTPPSGSPGILMGFLGGPNWHTWSARPARERRGAVLRSFASALGTRALRPTTYFEQDWTSEQWTLGGPTSVAAPGVTTAYGGWHGKRFGRVHWAGAELSPYWNGFMDGAVRSGEQVAKDIVGDN